MTKLLTVLLLVLPSALSAQPSLPNDPSQAPLGGIGFLAAAGGAYAIKKLKDRK